MSSSRASRDRAPRRRHDFAAGADGLDVLAGVGHLRADVERQPAHAHAEVCARVSSNGGTAAGSQPNLRDRSTTAVGLRNDTRSNSSARRRCRLNLRISSGLSATNVRMPKRSAARDIRIGLDRVRVDAAVRRDTRGLHQLDLAASWRRRNSRRGRAAPRRRPRAATASARSRNRRPAGRAAGCGTGAARRRSRPAAAASHVARRAPYGAAVTAVAAARRAGPGCAHG